MRIALLWAITQCVVVIPWRWITTTCCEMARRTHFSFFRSEGIHTHCRHTSI